MTQTLDRRALRLVLVSFDPIAARDSWIVIDLLVLIPFWTIEGTSASSSCGWSACSWGWSSSWPGSLVGGRASVVVAVFLPWIADDIWVQHRRLILLALDWLVWILLLFFFEEVWILPWSLGLVRLWYRLASHSFILFLKLTKPWIRCLKMSGLWLNLLILWLLSSDLLWSQTWATWLCFVLSSSELFSLLVKVVEFLMQESYLVFAEWECFSINQTFYCV